MTLRIPDDEVSRPNLPAPTPMGGVPAIGARGDGHERSEGGSAGSASRPPSSPEYDPVPVPMEPMKPQPIVNNGYPGSWYGGPWNTVTQGLYGDALVSSGTAGSKQSMAAWWFPVQPGTYDVSVTWPAVSGLSAGYGKIGGRLTAVVAYDFTVMAGSMGMTGEIKVTRLRELALTKRMPFVWLLDSAGARIQSQLLREARESLGLRARLLLAGQEVTL